MQSISAGGIVNLISANYILPLTQIHSSHKGMLPVVDIRLRRKFEFDLASPSPFLNVYV